MVKEIIYHEKSALRFIKHEKLVGESIGYMLNKMKNISCFFSRKISFCSWGNKSHTNKY